jgi:DNA-binding GntR family transcriptional regulator
MPVPDQREAVHRSLLRDTAHAALCDAIVSGTLAPGEQLHDAELCEWLGLSRTPVRDALARLEDEGLVETAPQRFTRVTKLDRRDVRDTFPVLAAMHALATELAVPVLERSDVKRLRAENVAYVRAMDAGDTTGLYTADASFHGILVKAAANPEVTRVLDLLGPRLRRLERLRTGVLPGRRSAAQHEAIIDRAAAGDAAKASSAARENWLTVGALMERTLQP